MRLFEKNAGPASEETGIVLNLLAEVYRKRHDMARAIAADERSWEIVTGLARPPEVVARILVDLGALYRDSKRYDKALEMYQREAALLKNAPDQRNMYLSAERNIVVSYVFLDDLANAKKEYQGLQALLKKDPAEQAAAAKAYSDALRDKKREKDARKKAK